MRSFQFKLDFGHFPQVQIRFIIDSKTRISCKEKVHSREEKIDAESIYIINLIQSQTPRHLLARSKDFEIFYFSLKKYFLSEIKGNEYRFHLKSKNITIKCCNCRSLGINKPFSSPRCTERLCKFPADNISSFPLAVKITNEESISSEMPLLGKKSYKPSPLPKDLKSEEEVFVIKETNEVFRSYEYPFVFL